MEVQLAASKLQHTQRLVPQPLATVAPIEGSGLDRFCQLQVNQLIAQSSIAFVQMTYADPSSAPHRQRIQASRDLQPLAPDLIQLIQSETWLTEFPLAFTVSQILLDNFLETVLYVCPYSYQQQQCWYLLVVAEATLSSTTKQLIRQTATILNEYLEQHLINSRQQQQIKTLEQIVQRVGHQVRQPLGLLNLYAENLCCRLVKGQLYEQASIIRETTQDLDRNLTELIYCSSSEALRVTPQELRHIVVESIQGLQAWIHEKQLRVIYPQTSILLSLDRLQIKQVFDNLLNNAIHFSPIAGTITFNWQVFHSEVLITIADQGSGLSPEDLRHLFTPFYSRRPQGTGLGLAIAQKVVRDHRGNLWAKNLPTQGAEFSLILPRSSRSRLAEGDSC